MRERNAVQIDKSFFCPFILHPKHSCCKGHGSIYWFLTPQIYCPNPSKIPLSWCVNWGFNGCSTFCQAAYLCAMGKTQVFHGNEPSAVPPLPNNGSLSPGQYCVLTRSTVKAFCRGLKCMLPWALQAGKTNLYSWPLNSTGLNRMGPLTCGFFFQWIHTTVLRDVRLCKSTNMEPQIPVVDCKVICGFSTAWGSAPYCSRVNCISFLLQL